MGNKQEEQVFRTVGSPKADDRFTVVLHAHYLEWDTGATTDVRWAYDRLTPTGKGTCTQLTLRVQPGSPTAIVIPGLDLDKCEVVLGHKMPQLSPKADLADSFAQEQRRNVIEIWDSEKMVGIIGPDRMMFGQFKGPLFAKCTRATALLHITAAPV
jgi:hypothetical protein